MTLAVEDSIHVGAAPEKVWRLVSDPFGWRFWWPQCKSAETVDRKPLRDGSQLEMTLQLGLVPFTVRATVEIAQPPRALLWIGKAFGVTARHAFYLEAKPNGTRVRERETFDGGGLLLFRLLRFEHATAVMFKQNLRGLKRMAERGL